MKQARDDVNWEDREQFIRDVVGSKDVFLQVLSERFPPICYVPHFLTKEELEKAKWLEEMRRREWSWIYENWRLKDLDSYIQIFMVQPVHILSQLHTLRQ